MKSYPTKTSRLFKLTTILILSVFMIICGYFFSIVITTSDFVKKGLLSVIILIIISVTVYFYLNQLNEIQYFKNDKIILKSNIKEIPILLNDIISVRKIRFSSIPMTTGSYGLFGVMCYSMDGYKTNYSDTQNIFAIDAINEKYLVSCSNSDELVQSLKNDIENEKP